MALTPKQQRFVDEYLIDLNATAAAKRAGCSNGRRMIRIDTVAAAIEAGQAKRSGRTEATQDTVVQGLLEEARRLGKDGSPAARVAAWKLVGQHLGMWRDDDLLREIAEIKKQLAADA